MLLLLVACQIAGPPPVDFAVIGDYGTNTTAELQVSQLVKSWRPEFIVTCGDNNYPSGSASTIDANIGKYYHEFIYNYAGSYGSGSSSLRFIPSPGNHDWGNLTNNPTGLDPYLAYFTLPGNERYFTVRKGSVEIFILDSDVNEPDGRTSNSVQSQWCQAALGASTATYKLVIFHHPAYSSGAHGSSTFMRWPFEAWGATAVLQGHDHMYERLQVGGIPYFVNGSGGQGLYNWGTILPESQYRYNADFGAMRVTATWKGITFRFYNRSGQLQDIYFRSAFKTSTAP